MDHILSRGFEPRVRYKEDRSRVCHTVFPPRDPYNLVYLSMVLAGAGFLLPYNSFITATDYFQAVFPGTTIVFDITLVYILTALIAVLLNNVIIYTFTLNSRIMFGYIISFLVLLFTLTCMVFLDLFPPDLSYIITLVCVAVVSVGATGKLLWAEFSLFFSFPTNHTSDRESLSKSRYQPVHN